MVAVQIISKVLTTKDLSLIQENNLTKDYFVGYEEEFQYLMDHFIDYGNVPDKETFLSVFPECDLPEVKETDKYLIDTINEEYMYYQSVPILQKAAKLLKTDAIAASEYMVTSLRDLRIIQTSGDSILYENFGSSEYTEIKDRQKDFFFTCGFQELDDVIHGINRQLELLVIVARTNQGKSWVLEKICTHVWQIGYSIGYISPEMTALNVKYRFDTLVGNFSNSALMWGKEIDFDKYLEHCKQVSERREKADFIVASPLDFNRQMTVSKMRSFALSHKLDLLAIDGITYMQDERYRKGDSINTSLTHIAEDLRQLSYELHIPVLIVVQSNRGGVREEDDENTPDIENIRDSDGISHNATKVLSIRQLKDHVLVIDVKKNTLGMVGVRVKYDWNIDTGEFTFMPDEGRSSMAEMPRRRSRRKEKEETKEDKF